MNIFCFTHQGSKKQLNTDALLVTGESFISNPWIINEQKEYSHYNQIKSDRYIALIADGLGSSFASKLATTVYNNDFINTFDLVGEQEVFYWISESFVRLELKSATESIDDTKNSTSGASIAGIVHFEKIGTFIFNSGDAKVYALKNNKVNLVSCDHFFNGVLQNCACAGGGHYISTSGALRDKTVSYFIVTSSFTDYANSNYSSIENVILDLASDKESSECMIKKIKDLYKDSDDNFSIIGIIN